MFPNFLDIPSYIQFSNQLGRFTEDDFSFDGGQYMYHEDNKYHYFEKGSGKQTILLLHGIMVTSNIWNNHINYFSENYKVYALDFLGHGLSSKKDDLHIEDLVNQVHSFIQKKQIKNPIIIGHSLGGLVASIYASTLPNNIKKLVLISCGEYESVTNNLFAQMNSWLLDLALPLINQYTFPMFLQSLSHRVYNRTTNFLDDSKSHIFYHFKIKGSKQSLFSLMKNTNVQNFSTQDYQNISCPTLVIHGENDRIVEFSHGKKLASFINGCEMEKIAGGSHMIIEENEKQVNQFMSHFIEKSENPLEQKDLLTSKA